MTSDDDSRKTRLEALAEVYDDILDWARTNYDRWIVKRNVEAVDPDSRCGALSASESRKRHLFALV